jgi:hypothetical protein
MTIKTELNPTGIVAIHDLPAGVAAGEITFLSVFGVLEIDALKEAWLGAGLPEELLPNKPTKEAALRGALNELKLKKELLRPLPKKEGKGYVLTYEGETDDPERPLAYDNENQITARLGYDTSDPNNAKPTVHFTPANWDRADAVRALFDERLNYLMGHQFGGWVWGRLAPSVRGVRIRKDGGICYVPPEHLSKWEGYREVIHAVCVNKLYGIPAMQSEGIVEAVLDGIKQEAQKEIDLWERELQRTGEQALGADALHTRERYSAAMRDKVAYYEALCAQALPDLRGKLDELDADITGALLMAAADDFS